MRKVLLIIVIITTSLLPKIGVAQQSTTYSYTVKIEFSEIQDYQLEQKEALKEMFNAKDPEFNEDRLEFTVTTSTFHTTQALKGIIERKGMKVLAIAAKFNASTSNNE